MSDFLQIVALMALVICAAASVLWVRDRLTLRSGMTQEQRAVAIVRNTDRTSRKFGVLMFIIAVSSLAMNAFSGAMSGLPKLLRVFWGIGAAGYVFAYLFQLAGTKVQPDDADQGPGDGSTS